MTVWPPGLAPAFSWTPTSTQVGTYAVTFTVNDGRGGTASETITIAVTPGATVTPSPGVSPASAALSDFRFSSSGHAITLMFTLTAPSTTDTPVTLTVAPTNPGFPPSETIPAGMANYQITFAAPAGSEGGTFTVTASAGGVSLTRTTYVP